MANYIQKNFFTIKVPSPWDDMIQHDENLHHKSFSLQPFNTNNQQTVEV